MQTPLQVTFHDTPVSDHVRELCEREAAKLERFFGRITSCRVKVEEIPHRHRKGNHWRIGILLDVPGGQLVVDRDPPQRKDEAKPELAIRAAFDEARRLLQDHARKLRGQVKPHAPRARHAVPGPAESNPSGKEPR